MSLRTPGTQPAARDKARVLIIDDDLRFRNLLITALREDYIVSVADGINGFRQALEHPPDLTIIDIQVSGWDGLKALKAFREHAQFANTGVVVLTSDASRETVLAAIEAGAHDYIVKSAFSSEAFLQRVQSLLARLRNEAAAAEISPPLYPSRYAASDQTNRPAPNAAPRELEARQLQDIIDSWEWHEK